MAYTDTNIQSRLTDTQHAGGENYTEAQGKLNPADADTTVSTLSGLQSALNSSASMIAVDSNINIGSAELDLGNKTVVGDRGWNGSNGPLLWTDTKGFTAGGFRDNRPYAMFYSYATSGAIPRLSGLRIRGAHWDEPWARYDDNAVLARAFAVRGNRGRVDNCRLHGWTWNSVHAMGYRSFDRIAQVEVDHCHIHSARQDGYGYGVETWTGFLDTHHNYFNDLRHCVEGFGWHDSGYDCYENVFGPDQRLHAVDMHSLVENNSGESTDPNHERYDLRAGGTMDVRKNTFTHFYKPSSISIRGVPYNSIEINNNRFIDTSAPPYNSGNDRTYTYNQQNVYDVTGYDDPAGYQEFTTNYLHHDNQYDSENTPWSTTYGASVNIDGDTPEPRADLAVNVRKDDGTEEGIQDATVRVTRIE